MNDDEFLKERADIRAKMLKYSRAINEGKKTDEILAPDEIARPSKGDEVLKKRLEKDKKAMSAVLNESPKERFTPKNLTDVKLEEKIPFTKRLLAKFKKKKNAPKASNAKSSQNLAAEKKQSANSNERLNANLTKSNSAQSALDSWRAKNLQGANSADKQSVDLTSKQNATPKATKSNLQDINLSNLNAAKPKNADIKSQKTPLNSAPKNENITQKENAPRSLKQTDFAKNSASSNLPTINSPVQTGQRLQIQLEEDSVKVKNVLLQGHSKATQDEKNLGKNQLLFAALCIVFAVVVFVPKIYITSNIYYLSRDIAALRTQESVLSEENKELNKKLENMRFQNQILDYLE